MSDYEGEGLDIVRQEVKNIADQPADWEIQDVQNEPAENARDRKPPTQPSSWRSQSGNNNTAISSRHSARRYSKPKTRHNLNLQPNRQNIQSRWSVGPNNKSLGRSGPASSNQSRVPPGPPDHEYILSKSWSDILKKLSHSTRDAREIAQQQFDKICGFSEAYLQVPTSDTNVVPIWGSPDKVERATSQLLKWEMSSQAQPEKSKESVWSKSHAYDGRKEHRRMQEAYDQFAAQARQHADDSHFKFEAYLIWPPSYDLDAYLNTFESTALPQISAAFSCNFYHQRGDRPRYTRVRCQDEKKCLAAYQRLIGLVKEMVFTQSPSFLANCFLLPSQEWYRKTIQINLDQRRKVFTFKLHGDLDQELSKDDWQRLVQHIDKCSRDTARDGIDQLLQELHLSAYHIRLRVEFGHLGLKSFQKPQSGTNIYKTDKFLEMIRNTRTQLSECALISDGGDIFRLVETIKAMPEFYQPEETYKVSYDFQESNRSSRIRLETELVEGYDAGETQIRAQRWLHVGAHNDRETILDIKILDLHNPSFALRVTGHEIVQPSQLTKELRRFQNTHSFKPDTDGLNAFPRRRSIIPPGQKDLVTVTETTALKMRVTDMDGIFELQREDVYDHRDGKDSPWPVSSRWIAHYYYYGWDSRFDDFANLGPGEDIAWPRKVFSLFPKESSEENADLLLAPKFRTFWNEVKLIQGYLSTAMSRLQSSNKDSSTK